MIPPLLVDALATYRLVRLATRDELSRPVREKYLGPLLTTRDPGGDDFDVPRMDAVGRIAYAASCPWCSSVYIAAAVVLARRTMPARWEPLAEVLAVAALAGMALDRDRG